MFLAETVPKFDGILALIGASTVTFLTFVAPSLFYLRLCSLTNRFVSLHERVFIIEIMCIGIIGGIVSSYAAIKGLTSPASFVPPCYVNMTLATGSS